MSAEAIAETLPPVPPGKPRTSPRDTGRSLHASGPDVCELLRSGLQAPQRAVDETHRVTDRVGGRFATGPSSRPRDRRQPKSGRNGPRGLYESLSSGLWAPQLTAVARISFVKDFHKRALARIAVQRPPGPISKRRWAALPSRSVPPARRPHARNASQRPPGP
jgi:hypothetical protein